MKVAFRTDASVEIGTGHVMRCLTLADALRERGGEAHFVCRGHPGHLGEVIEDRGHRLHLLSPATGEDLCLEGELVHAAWLGVRWDFDASETAAILNELGGVDWLVVDHYALDARWEGLLRPAARRILAIDDLADRPHDCDLLLDQNYFLDQETRYRGLVPSACRPLLGPRYALLRPEFAAVRKRGEPRSGEVRKVLVYFGGVDAADQTSRALAALEALGRNDLEVDAVIGAMHPNREAVERHCHNRRGYRLYRGGADMAELIAGADLAIGAGGASTWERACLGLPSIVVCLAENQRRLAEDLAEAGGCLYLGEAGQVTAEAIAQALRLLADNPHLRRALAAKAAALVDGRGAQRLAGRMVGAQIVLRRATAVDCRDLYSWRNAEETRRHAHDDRPIAWDAHEKWLKETLHRRDRLLLIGELDGRPVGVLRYDLEGGNLEGEELEGERATVSVYLVPGRHGAGLGSGLIEAGSEYLAREAPQVNEIVAEIRAGNPASCKAFEGAGYALGLLRYTVMPGLS